MRMAWILLLPLGLVLAGQVVASMVIDHFGLIELPAHEASTPPILGALLMVAGVVIVQRF